MFQRGNYCSFLVRMWRQPLDSDSADQSQHGEPEAAKAGATWLLQIEHIPGGERQYFASLEDMFAFIRAFANEHTCGERSRTISKGRGA